MLTVDISYFAVFGAAVISIILGALWYGPFFGKKWMKLSGLSQTELDSAKKRGMGKLYFIAFVGSLFTAYVLANFIDYLLIDSFGGAFSLAFWAWFGFVGPITLGSVLWENKSWNLWFLNNFYYLISFVLMASVLAFW